MKKILSIAAAALLTVLFVLSGHTTAFAGGFDETYEENGFALHYTDAFEDTKGTFYAHPAGYDYEAGVGSLVFWYLAMPQEEMDALYAKDEWTEAEEERYNTVHGELMEVVSVNGGRGVADLLEMAPGLELSEDWFTEVGRADDVTFFALMIPEDTEDYLEGIEPAYRKEFKTLQKELVKVLKKGKYFEPVVRGADLVGKTLRFETTDVDGNPVKSEELFRENEITMVNVWATWCPSCVGELAELSKMNERLAEKNVAVVGICLDADTKLDACKELIEKNGVAYQNLLPFDGMQEALELNAYPSSYFIGSDGTMLTVPFVGAPAEMSAYEAVIDRLLAGEETGLEEAGAQSKNDAGLYRVFVADEDGNPVEGAVVQFCSDSTCTMGKTDKNGAAEFEAEEGTYTVHILKAPKGFEKTDEEIETDAVYSDIYFVLKKF